MPVQLRALLSAQVLSKLIVRAQHCAISIASFFQSALTQLSEQAIAAASNAIAEAAAPGAQSSPSKISVVVRGPLLVVPSTASASTAAMMQLADLSITTETVQRTDEEQNGNLVERIVVHLSNGRMLVAIGSAALDPDWRLLDGYMPHWMLRDFGVRASLDRPVNVTGGHESGGAPCATRQFRGRLVLAPIQLSLAHIELALLLSLLDETVAAFSPALRDEPTESDQSSIRFVPLNGGDESLPSLAPAVQDGTATPSLEITMTVESEGGLRLTLNDDSSGSLKPLYQLSLERLCCNAHVMLETDSAAQSPLSKGNAGLEVELSAHYFNGNNGCWEPVVEPWVLLGNYAYVPVELNLPDERLAPPDFPDEDPGGGVAQPVGKRVASAPGKAVTIEHQVTLSSQTVLDINVSYELLRWATISAPSTPVPTSDPPLHPPPPPPEASVSISPRAVATA